MKSTSSRMLTLPERSVSSSLHNADISASDIIACVMCSVRRSALRTSSTSRFPEPSLSKRAKRTSSCLPVWPVYAAALIFDRSFSMTSGSNWVFRGALISNEMPANDFPVLLETSGSAPMKSTNSETLTLPDLSESRVLQSLVISASEITAGTIRNVRRNALRTSSTSSCPEPSLSNRPKITSSCRPLWPVYAAALILARSFSATSGSRTVGGGGGLRAGGRPVTVRPVRFDTSGSAPIKATSSVTDT
mmetsp:Transcript_110731/g.195674  ORF Transcript_110731/g.195674 Transcript_110731/m.195674 type:complete len:248 (-) Transcript_110731:158-901(-)